MRERHEHFRRRLLVTPDLVSDDRDLTGVTMLVAEPFEDALPRMALLMMALLVGL